MRLIFILPLAVFIALAAAFGWQLVSGNDPSLLPSALVGQPMPAFDLPPVEEGAAPLSSESLEGEPALVNFFASWCVPCRAEHPILLDLEESGVAPIYGIDYKDKIADGRQWLEDLGNPFTAVGSDLDGRVGIDFGVYGVPETYVVDAEGIIRHRHVGPLMAKDVEKVILPLLERLKNP